MSRNKDRYESSNPRRQQIFMSQEDVAAGRKSNWTGVEITGEFVHTAITRRHTSVFLIRTFLLTRFFACVYIFIHRTGNVRNVSPTLWQFDHLTALYLNDNNLLRLPSDIGQLLNLRTLDLSNNKLRSLPAELGELIHLR